MTAADIINALATKYRAPEYAFLTEVRNSVGFSAKVRTADAMAMSLWPSRGLYMTGFEVKVSRADWKKELEQPEKAEELARFCKMWFVACPDKMIDKDEVPPGWGLIHVKDDGGLRYVKPAPEHSAAEPTWMLFASLMRDVVENWVPSTLVDQRIEAASRERMARRIEQEGYELKEAKRQLEKLRENIAAFEAASGVKIDRYSAMTLTKRQLEILQHALGLDEYGRGAANRNHYCAGRDDIPDCAELVAIGYMRSWREETLPYFNCWVTDKGKVSVRRESPAPPKLTRSQKRYRAFMDADLGCSFGEYLKWYCGRRAGGAA